MNQRVEIEHEHGRIAEYWWRNKGLSEKRRFLIDGGILGLCFFSLAPGRKPHLMEASGDKPSNTEHYRYESMPRGPRIHGAT